ncbi:MAG: hypothetical protein JXB49_34105 [Bacteroidales bacterium]|nr:hypothetical protein [Bacteroidales bacterium]
MKKFIFLTLIITNTAFLYSQNVGINDDNSQPDASAMLDIKSSDRGLLLPRVQLVNLNSASPVTNPATGLLIYNDGNNVDKGFYYWDGSKWVQLVSGEGIIDNDSDSTNEIQDLSLSGNTLSLSDDASTVDLSKYLDNTDSQSLQQVLSNGNSANSLKISNLANPTSAQDAATKYYVDNNDAVNDNDADPANEIQDLSLSSNTLSLSGDASTVDLSKYLDNTDNQQLSISGDQLSITPGNTITLPSSSQLTLPYSGTYSGTSEVFRIDHNGSSGRTLDLRQNNTGNNADALLIENYGTSYAANLFNRNTVTTSPVLNVQSDGPSDAVGYFTLNNSNGGSAVQIESNGEGNSALYVNMTGSREAAKIELNNASSNYYALKVTTTSSSGKAARFEGNVYVTGDLSVGGAKDFLIDHPLDPENKILRHSCIESPEMMNIYKGHAKLDSSSITIKLPDYFDALNNPEGREISLTPFNGWSPLYLDGKIENNQFVVKTTSQGNPSQEFSWVIYAVRNDAYAKDHPIVVEEEKGEGNGFKKGELLYNGKK